MPDKLPVTNETPADETGGTAKEDFASRRHGVFDSRFRLYEKINVSLNTMNIVVTVVSLLLIAAVVIGVLTAGR